MRKGRVELPRPACRAPGSEPGVAAISPPPHDACARLATATDTVSKPGPTFVFMNAAGRIRTDDLLFFTQALLPTELSGDKSAESGI